MLTISMVERENFCRFCGILLDVGAKVLRATFMDEYVGSITFANYLKSHKRDLSKLHTLRQEQFDRLYPPSGVSPSIDNLDITLLCVMFRNLDTNSKPSDSVWTNPLLTDESYQADVTRIRLSRNTLFGHVESASIDAVTFNKEINILKTVYKRLVKNLSPGRMSVEELRNLMDYELNSSLQKDQENEIKRLRVEIETLHKHDIMCDSGRLNFYHLSLLILDVGTHILKCYFEKLCTASCDLQQFLSSKKTKLEELCIGNIITQNEKDVLLSNTGCQPLLEDLTISLLTSLLINLCEIPPPIRGWIKSPEAGDKSPGADILRLRNAKDSLASRPKCAIVEAEFHEEWFNICVAISRLSDQLDQQQRKDIQRKIKETRQANIDSDRDKGIRELIFKEICKHSEMLKRSTGSSFVSSDDELSDEDESQIDEDIQMPQGEEGKICIIKRYAVLKLELEKDQVMDIAKNLFKKKNSKDTLEEMAKARRRRLCVDCLLKRVLRENAPVLQSFFDLLKMKRQTQKIARRLAETKVTEEDRIKFKQVSEQAKGMIKVSGRIQNGCRIEESDIEFFQCRLFDFPEDVDGINDVLLSQFHCSIWDHSRVTQCSNPNEKICVLFKTIQSCHFDSESELQNVLGSSLYEEWKQSKYNASRQGLENQGIWHSLLQRIQSTPAHLMARYFGQFGLRLMWANRGSIVLKFEALDNFDVELLKPEPVKKAILGLIKTVCPEYQVLFKEPLLVTLFFKPPSNTDKAEIYFHLETSLEMKEKEDKAEIYFHLETSLEMKEKEESSCGKIGSHDIDYMVEEMNPTSLKKWIFNKLHLDKQTKVQLVDMVSWKDMSRREKMRILLSTVESLENGYKLLEKYCEENDTVVYDRVFRKHIQLTVEENTKADQFSGFSYEKGERLQKLFSTWIYFTVDPKDIMVDVGKSKFVRFAQLVLDVGTCTLKWLFEKQYAARGDLEMFVRSRNKVLHHLYRRKIITREQMDFLQPITGIKPSLENLDTSLLTILLISVCLIQQPLCGWTVSPAANDMSTGADILRLRDARNYVIHHALYDNSDADFQLEWSNISAAILRLSNQLGPQQCADIQKKINDIRQADEDPVCETQICEPTITEQIWDIHQIGQKLVAKEDKSSDVGTFNFFQLSHLILDVGTFTLKWLFEKQYAASGDLEMFVRSKNRILHHLYRKKIITRKQMDLLQPITGIKPSLENLDISLLTILLINICPIQQPLCGWTVSPAANDMSTGADILRLRDARNDVFHRAVCDNSDADFQLEWSNVSAAILRLSSQLGPQQRVDIQKKINDIRQAVEDPMWKTQSFELIFADEIWQIQQHRLLRFIADDIESYSAYPQSTSHPARWSSTGTIAAAGFSFFKLLFNGFTRTALGPSIFKSLCNGFTRTDSFL